MHANLPTLPTPAVLLRAAHHKIVAVGAFETVTRQRRKQLASSTPAAVAAPSMQVHIRRERGSRRPRKAATRVVLFMIGHIHTVL